MAYADSIRTTDYTREELADLIDGNRIVGEAPLTSGTQPNYTVTLSPAPAAYFAGMEITVRVHQTNTAGPVYINVNGLGAKLIRVRSLTGSGSRNLYLHEFLLGNTARLVYDGGSFVLDNPAGGFSLDTQSSYNTSGTAPNYTVNIYPTPIGYINGLTFPITIHSNLTNSSATLNVNGLGARSLKVKLTSGSTRNISYYELNNGGTYIVTYDGSSSHFIVHNPNLGQEINFTPTWGVVGGGPVSLLNNYDTNYRWITPTTLRVRTYCNLNLSTATSGLTFALPFAADGDDRFVTGSGFFSSLTSYTTYLSLPYLYTDLTTVRILPNIAGGTISADSSFNCIMNIIYNVNQTVF